MAITVAYMPSAVVRPPTPPPAMTTRSGRADASSDAAMPIVRTRRLKAPPPTRGDGPGRKHAAPTSRASDMSLFVLSPPRHGRRSRQAQQLQAGRLYIDENSSTHTLLRCHSCMKKGSAQVDEFRVSNTKSTHRKTSKSVPAAESPDAPRKVQADLRTVCLSCSPRWMR